MEVDSRLSTESAAILGRSGGSDLAQVERRVAEREGRKNDDLSYLVVDQAGLRLAGSLAMEVPKPGFSDVDFTDGVEGIDHGRALATPLAHGATLLLVADYGPVEDLNRRLLQIGAITLSVVIGIGVIAGFALSRSIARRIEATAQIAASIMAGKMDQRMPLDGTGGAFDRQATVLNAMLDRIQELMANLQQISSDVAHDLRTPLSLLRSNLASIVSLAPGKILRNDVEKVLAQSDELLALFKAILRISEIEAGSRRTYFVKVDLCELVNEIVATFAASVELSDQTLIAGRIDMASIIGDRELIAQALINLVENAAKHAGSGTQITLSVERMRQFVAMTVRDNGPGIASRHHGRALQRFGRLDSSRSKPGHGLGLSLVDSIARLHGGRFMLGDANPGLIVTIQLPLSPTT